MPSLSFHIQTYGCQMNASDSDWLVRSLKNRGFVEAPFEEASIYILNTCSVREKPEKKVYSELGKIAQHSKVHKRTDVTVCVGGCVAQQVGIDLAKRFPQVRLLFGTDGISHAPEAIEQLMDNQKLRINLLDFADTYEEREDPWLHKEAQRSIDEMGEEKAQVPPSVFVNIMQGCNNFCTYCIVPYVRGKQKSRKQESILNECQQLLAQGTRELTLLGQNVNSYGLDTENEEKLTEGTSPFAQLLEKIIELPGLERLRFMTPHPKDISSKVIEAFGTHEILCPRLHLPLQSGSNTILKRMGRRYTVEKYLSIVQQIKSVRPDIVFSSDIIVGFPGETEEDFLETLSVMQEVGFVATYSFIYSDRPKAKAVLFKDKIQREVALERLSRLQEWQNNFTESVLRNQVGLTKNILLERRSPREAAVEKESTIVEQNILSTWQGRTDQGFIVNVALPPLPGDTWTGKMLTVTIHESGRHSLKGKQVGQPW